MKQIMLVGCLVGSCWGGMTMALAEESNQPAMKTIYDFVMKDISGNDVPLSTYKGKVLLIVNVASRCGFTSQYAGLEALYERYKDAGLVVLGFPANDFMGQEPGTNEQIKQFCETTFRVTFPMFSKISVKGSDIHPLYAFLTSGGGRPDLAGAISWNFNKFLVARDGTVVERFGSRDTPEGDKIMQAVEKALAP